MLYIDWAYKAPADIAYAKPLPKHYLCFKPGATSVVGVQTRFVGMMQYDGDLKLPANFLVPPPAINHVSGQYLAANGVSTFACSETQKFGHVTFFWNGNRSGYFSEELETFVEARAAQSLRNMPDRLREWQL